MKPVLRRICALLFSVILLLTSTSALTVEQALQILQIEYVNELPPEAESAQSVEELIDLLHDPYTTYMDEQQYTAFLDGVEHEGSLCGIGATIRYTEDGIAVLSVIDGAGAQAAGIVPGDLIIAIDGGSCAPASEADRNRLLGEEGTTVRLTTVRESGKTEDIIVRRAPFVVHNTETTIENGVVTIDCDSFGTQTGDYFEAAIAENAEQAHIFLIDLRSNGGGVTDSAINAVGAFVGRGQLLSFFRRDKLSLYHIYRSEPMTDLPVIVLTDDLSASATEIFTADIRALHAGISVGTRTYGKGVAQTIFDGSNCTFFQNDALKLTVYRFYTADGNTTDQIGVLPTLNVPDEYAKEIADLLCGKQDASREQLCLYLNENAYFVDLADAVQSHPDAFRELLKALPTEIAITRTANGTSEEASADALCEQYGVARVSFSDVADSPYAENLNTMKLYGILLGDGEESGNTFRPRDTMTRAELCAMLSQAINAQKVEGGRFSDVSDDSWYADAVNAIASLGLVNGVGDGKFAPEETITQEQFITIMGRLAIFLNYNISSFAKALSPDIINRREDLSRFADWAKKPVLIMAEWNDESMLYAPMEQLDPSAALTREQAGDTICKLLKGIGFLVY